MSFQIYALGERQYEPVSADARGFQSSEILACRFRIDRQRDEDGLWVFDLQTTA